MTDSTRAEAKTGRTYAVIISEFKAAEKALDDAIAARTAAHENYVKAHKYREDLGRELADHPTYKAEATTTMIGKIMKHAGKLTLENKSTEKLCRKVVDLVLATSKDPSYITHMDGERVKYHIDGRGPLRTSWTFSTNTSVYRVHDEFRGSYDGDWWMDNGKSASGISTPRVPDFKTDMDLDKIPASHILAMFMVLSGFMLYGRFGT